MTVVTLDYPKHKLFIDADTEFEHVYRARACEKEPWTVAFIESIPAGATLWDVGANVGPYSIVAAKLGLNVIAIEPVGENYGALVHNLSLNHMRHSVLALPIAVGAESGFDWLHMADMRRGAGGHTIGPIREHATHRQRVMVDTLNHLLATLPVTGPHYLKIDVDGGELDVLVGAGDLLTVADGVMIEIEHVNRQKVTEVMADHGLRLVQTFDHRGAQPIEGIVYGEYRR
jgi:FkbM family methyltransferase